MKRTLHILRSDFEAFEDFDDADKVTVLLRNTVPTPPGAEPEMVDDEDIEAELGEVPKEPGVNGRDHICRVPFQFSRHDREYVAARGDIYIDGVIICWKDGADEKELQLIIKHVEDELRRWSLWQQFGYWDIVLEEPDPEEPARILVGVFGDSLDYFVRQVVTDAGLTMNDVSIKVADGPQQRRDNNG